MNKPNKNKNFIIAIVTILIMTFGYFNYVNQKSSNLNVGDTPTTSNTFDTVKVLKKTKLTKGNGYFKENEQIIDLSKKDLEYQKRLEELNTEKEDQYSKYSEDDYEYNSEIRIEAYKFTKEYLKNLLHTQKPSCNITNFKKFNPNRVSFTGNKTYTIIIDLSFECNNDGYYNRKRFWLQTNNHRGQWKSTLLKTRFID